MRKDCKVNESNRDIADRLGAARVQGYHECGFVSANRESYAFMGFNELKFFNSDRFMKLALVNGVSVRTDGKSLKGYGLEIETECWSITDTSALAEVYDKIIFKTFPAGLFKMQSDSTLSGGHSSAEVITQVMSKAFIRNHYKDWKVMFNHYFNAFQISASRSGNCGMHVNISTGNFGEKPEMIEEAVKKLLYIVNHHYDFCSALFYRDASHRNWCGKMRGYATKDGCKAADLHNMPGSHGNCMNYSHFDAGRIEIRLVGGQKDFPCFRNTMESIFWLVDRVKKISWSDCDSLVKIFSGCNQYVADRIATYCYQRGTISAEDVNAIRMSVKPDDFI